MLDIYDEQLHEFSKPIHHWREVYAGFSKQKTNEIYHFLSDKNEEVEIEYQSQLYRSNLLELLKQNRHKDIVTQRSNYGIHKDELFFSLNGMPLKVVASQGQRKCFLFGLKFAQYEILKEKLPVIPILLLDDIFEKLDEKRGERLIQYIGQQSTQVSITDTHKERLVNAFNATEKKVQWIAL